MTSRPRRLVLLCGLLPTFVTVVLSLYRPSFLANLEYGAYDTVVRATRTRPPGGGIVIVNVDERSLSAIGQWPWRRDLIGKLISRMRDLGASTIALDIIFAESDREAGTGVATDKALADTLRAGGVVLASYQQPAPPAIEVEEGAKAQALLNRMIVAKGGLEKLKAIKSITAVTKALLATPNGSVQAETTTYLEYPNRVHVETTLQQESQVQVYDGHQAWVKTSRGVQDVPERAVRNIEMTFRRDIISALLAARDGQLRARLLPDVKDDEGVLHHALELSGTDVDPFVLFVDPATGLITKQTYVVGGPGQPLIEELSSDYRPVDGVQVAFRAKVRQGGRQMVDRQVTEFKVNAPLDPSLFKRPAA